MRQVLGSEITKGSHMHRLMWLAIAGIVLALPARAEWVVETGEDLMTDQKWAAASASFGEAEVPKVLFKCWQGGHVQLAIFVAPYNDAASYASSVTTKFRVEKNAPVEIHTIPMNLGGALALGATNLTEPELLPLVTSILHGQSRVALSIGDALYETDVKGTAKATGAMSKVCGLGTK
jgi:hypothetical protein